MSQPPPHAAASEPAPAAVFLAGTAEANSTRDTQEADVKNIKSSEDGQMKFLMRVFKYADRKGVVMNALAVVCMVASGTALPLMDIVFGAFVTIFNDFMTGRMSPQDFRSQVNTFTLYYLYLFAGKFVLTYIWTLLISISATRTTKALRVDFLRQTLRQEIAFFDGAGASSASSSSPGSTSSSSSSSSVAGQVTTNANIINQGISERLGLVVQAMSMFVAAFVVALAVHWKLTLIIISIVPVNIGVTVVCVYFDVLYENRIFDIYARAGSLAEEVFASIRTVHSFWAFPRLSRKFEAVMDEARDVGMKKSPVYAVLFCVEFFCVYAAYALAFWRGVRMYASGEISEPGTIVTVIFAVIVAAQALVQVSPQFTHISKAAAAAQELFRTIDRVSDIDSLSDSGLRPSNVRGNIELSGVGFSYPTRRDVQILKDFSLSIPADKTTALVGASGSGKSTIVGLVERWYDPLEGRITLDGHDVRDLNLQWLRSNIRLVQQEPTLFNATVYQNVAYGLTGTSLAEVCDEEKRRLVEEACKAAFAHEFVDRLPQGYDTKVGERGASLSGGQKQRIVIARSIISNPKVLLLDEATSALDPGAERIVQKALNNAASGRTMIVIAHRLSTIRDADNIVVMSHGRVIEQGTHSRLMDSGDAYARLVHTQDLGERGNDHVDDSDAEPNVKEEAVVQKVSTPANAENQGVSGGDTTETKKTSFGVLRCLWVILKEQKEIWHPWAWIVVGSIVAGGTYPAVAVLFSHTMAIFERERSDMPSAGDFWALMFFVLALANLVAYAGLGIVGNKVSQVIVRNYRIEMFHNTMRQDMSFFDEPENTTGALVARLSSDPQNLQELISLNIALLIVILVNVASSCILAIVVGWKLGLVLVFAALPPLVACGYLRIRLEYRLDEDNAARFAGSSGLAAEAVMAIRTVASLTLEREVLLQYQNAVSGTVNQAFQSLGWRMLWYALSQSISFLAMALGFWYGGRLMSFGEYDTTRFYTVFIAIIFSGEAAAMFFQSSSSITKAKMSANHVFWLRRRLRLSQGNDESDGSDEDADEPKDSASVTFKELGFAYPQRPNVRVLKGITAKIEAGQSVAFVGASGCGKTTMISLLERFYNPTSGEITFGSREIAATNKRSYRRNVSLVAQEPVLYHGSVRENVALGTDDPEALEDPSDERILAACKQANIRDFVLSLPEGLDTLCGTRGLQLSGGQRQRIAIARALVRGPRLLLLDEATSALDSESEAVVKEALDKAAEGRTTISVAHRLSTVRDADVIFVFDAGRIVETGSHEALLAKKGVYYEMCLGQSLDKTV